MSELFIDVTDVEWLKGRQPAPVVGRCPHRCSHESQSVIAWGPSRRHYELVECVGECDGRCRAWTDGTVRMTTPWMEVSQ